MSNASMVNLTKQTVPPWIELGVPVRSVNWVRLFAGQNAAGEPLLLAVMGQDAGGFFVCEIDPASGRCTQHPCGVGGANFPTAAYQNPRSGVLYVGSAYAGRLHHFDPNVPRAQRSVEDLGQIDPQLCTFPCRIDEAPDGTIWIGAYGGCSLTRFDPLLHGAYRRFGRMDDTDMYFYPLCGADGTVAGLVKMCRQHVVAIDPRSGERRPVGPVVDTDAASRAGGEMPRIDLVKAADGLLYIQATAGNFALLGMEATPVDRIPQPSPAERDAAGTLADGTRAAFLDRDAQIFRTVRLTSSHGSTRDLALDWRSDGTNVYLIHHGPDGNLYGSSILPEHLFTFDPRRTPADDNPKDLGQCSRATGEAYSMGNLNGKLYIGSYPGARLSVYDPARPYQFGEDEAANPRDLGRMDPVAYRPRSMLCGPAGKVWVASIPDYGMWGGTLAWHDPATGRFGSHRHLIQDCSPTTLEWLPELGLILVGLTVHGGSGTTPRASAGGFVLWDPVRDEAVWSGDFGLANLDGVPSLLRADDGSVWAVAVFNDAPLGETPRYRAELLLLHVSGRRVLARSPFAEDEGWPVEVSLRQGPDGWVYGALKPGLYRVRRDTPGRLQRQTVWATSLDDHANFIDVMGPIVGDRLYLANKYRLRAMDLR